QHNKVIIIVNGRIESACKYQELFYDLFHQGYDIYSFDHRGQGLSERLIADPQMGYVEQFDDYVRDMDELITRFPLQNYTQRYLLA
ncbi:alpha/beta fold hydrolase, partial [Bacillus cereus group sp. Bce039]